MYIHRQYSKMALRLFLLLFPLFIFTFITLPPPLLYQPVCCLAGLFFILHSFQSGVFVLCVRGSFGYGLVRY